LGAIVRIQVLPDYTEWITPGDVPPRATVVNLRSTEVARSPSLAQILYHTRFVDQFGTGIDIVLVELSKYKHNF
jgi:predicted HTH transcriptional regulator